jgi:multidrug efflux pump subunit AcrA (membrane-fusion protein)
MILEWERPRPQGARLSLWLMGAGLAMAVLWAASSQVQVYASLTGRLEPKGQMARLQAPTAGRVLAVYVRPWSQVRAGQALFLLDALAMDAQSGAFQLQNQRAAVREAEEAEAAQQETERLKSARAKDQAALYAVGAIPRVEAEIAQSEARQAVLVLRQASSRLKTARLTLARFQQQQQLVVRAPVSGQLALLAVQRPGEMVQQGMVLAEVLPSGTPLVFRALVPESERPKVSIGVPAELSWNSYPRQKYGNSQGWVTGVAPMSEVAPGSNASGYQVEVTMQPSPNFKPRLRAGMLGEARAISHRKSALALLWDWLRGLNPWD